ncbi:MAG: alpha/beta hydrolase [Alphaproteobacteria bacterium]|nr:alpha/beta hydrolase [Alphaproteobacteria bacterium]
MVKLLVAGGVVYGLIVAGMALAEPKLVFHPPDLSEDALAALAQQAGAREIRVQAEDGTGLYGWRLGQGPRLALLFNGNGSSVAGYGPRYARFVKAGFEVLHVNYRGYPGSEGAPAEAGLRMDARAAWAEARRTHDPQDIVVFGKSLGGGVAVGLVAGLPPEEKPRALLLESTFTAAVDVAAHAYPWLPVRWVMRNRFDSLSRAGSLGVPTVLVHGDADAVIPAGQSRRLGEAIPGSTLIIVPGGDHNGDMMAYGPAWEAARGVMGI